MITSIVFCFLFVCSTAIVGFLGKGDWGLGYSNTSVLAEVALGSLDGEVSDLRGKFSGGCAAELMCW